MNQFLERTLSHLTGNGNIDLVGIEELEKLTEEYPYFPIGQMLLAKKLKSQNDPRFLSQVQKTALYFSNPYWLHYQLLNAVPSAPILHDNAVLNEEDGSNEKDSINLLIIQEEVKFPPATPKFSKDHIAASGQLAKVVLSDGDDNVGVEQMVHGSSTLLEPVAEKADKEVERNIVEPIDADAGFDDQPILDRVAPVETDQLALATNEGETETSEIHDAPDKRDHEIIEEEQTLLGEIVKDVPITTEFSLEEIKASDELAHETLAEVDSEKDGETKFILPGDQPVQEDVPITTEFTLEELRASEELAHETLAEVDTRDTAEPKFILPEAPPSEDIPITTEFSLEELQASDELAHETLAEVDTRDTAEPKFILPEAPPSEDIPITTEFSLEELQASDELAHETLAEVDSEAAEEQKFTLPEPSTTTEPDEIEAAHVLIPETLTEDEGDAPQENNRVEEPGIEEEHKDSPENEPAEGIDEEHSPEEGEQDEIPGFSSDEMLRNIKSILDAPLPHDKTAKNEPLVPIDPYYTVDYFASQGIKLVLEKEPKDKLGRQLKSFTQWLKHMKKTGPEEALEESRDTDAEAMIIRIADFSNTQREIITEAMANVLEKQGKIDKAVQIYIKLSFLYPDKSAYFANKIKNLKGIL